MNVTNTIRQRKRKDAVFTLVNKIIQKLEKKIKEKYKKIARFPVI